MIKRMNSTIRYALSKTVDQDYSNWDLLIPQISLGVRLIKSARTGHYPYYLMFGRSPRMPIDEKKNVVCKLNTNLREMKLEYLPGLQSVFSRESTSPKKSLSFKLD
ncbi:hypothetical protein AYI69_g9677 [Smittium culicis]|uniref:Retrovirus-related Pol polyprotein from transposon n=1 Tax=Smittium culicis TaxID=133412 RepID=A0A1R1XB48_9FUNG|nr:hypothetical protein AYI69_g9677 [Smittium culicis]